MKFLILVVALATTALAIIYEDEYELVRVPRQLKHNYYRQQRPRPVNKYYPQEMNRYQQEPPRYIPMEAMETAPSNKEPLQASASGGGHGHHDYVDYGAYTGGWGAFGWYSDHPVGGGWGH